jgi:hypothetical protein
MPCAWQIQPATCDSGWDSYPAEVQDFAIQTASAVLWSSTGRQFGECELTVRPCGKWDGNAWWGGWMWGFYNTGWSWGGYLFEGSLADCGCWSGGNGWCDCTPANQIWLPGPVSQIVSVNQNGTTVDPTTYRVDDFQWLVRTSTAGSSTVNEWPWRQNYNVNSGSADTLTVVYKRGRPVPPPLLMGAGQLASQYARACMNADCALPARVQSVVRQNVSIHAVPLESMLKFGLTGLPIVDQLIRAYNPYGLPWATTILSPDQPTKRMVTWSGP